MPVCDLAQVKHAASSFDCWVALWFFAGNAYMPRLCDIEPWVATGGAAAAAGGGVAGAACCASKAGVISVPRSAATRVFRDRGESDMSGPPQRGGTVSTF